MRYLVTGVAHIDGESEDCGYYDATIERDGDVNLQGVAEEAFNTVLAAYAAGVSLVKPVKKEEWRATKCSPRYINH